MTKSAVGYEYLIGIIELPGGGTIELTKEIKRPGGKGKEAELSAVKRIYKLKKVKVRISDLKFFSKIIKEDGITTEVSSKSGETNLKVKKINRMFTSVTGKATFQALETLELSQHVIKK